MLSQTVFHDGFPLPPASAGSLLALARLEPVARLLTPQKGDRVVALTRTGPCLALYQVIAVSPVVIVRGITDGLCPAEKFCSFAHHDLLAVVLSRIT